MTPKEKADELCKKMLYQIEWNAQPSTVKGVAKQCALIAVDEILSSRPLDPNYVDWDDCGAAHQYWYEAQKEEALEFWEEVKQEIERL
jgi:hypothetical protein